jgi:hypothetical protein
MTMIVGDAKLGTGMAGAIAGALVSLDSKYDVNKAGGDLLPNAIAQAVVDYIQTNASVVGVQVDTVTGLQIVNGSVQ